MKERRYRRGIQGWLFLVLLLGLLAAVCIFFGWTAQTEYQNLQIEAVGRLGSLSEEAADLLVRSFEEQTDGEDLARGEKILERNGYGPYGIRRLYKNRFPRLWAAAFVFLGLGTAAIWLAAERERRGWKQDLEALQNSLDLYSETGEYIKPEITYEMPGDLTARWEKMSENLSGKMDSIRKDRVQMADYLENVSHQLKTPLAGILANLGAMKGTLASGSGGNLPQSTQLAAEISRCEREAVRTRQIVQQLLRMARLDAGKVTMRRRRVLLRDIVREAAESLMEEQEERDVSWGFEIDEKITLTADPFWMREAVSNVLKNALQHSPEGSKIRIRAEQRGMWIMLSIQDAGRGISEKDLPHIFERFYRAPGDSSGGTGIGLNLAREVAKEHGGNLTAENAAEGGAVFTFRLPDIPGTDSVRMEYSDAL